MRRVRVTPSARRDILAIWEFIARDDPDAADRRIDRLESAAALLARMPRAGHQRPDLADERHLFWTVGSYVVVYRPLRLGAGARGQSGIAVVRVLHGARDIAAIFEEE